MKSTVDISEETRRWLDFEIGVYDEEIEKRKINSNKKYEREKQRHENNSLLEWAESQQLSSFQHNDSEDNINNPKNQSPIVNYQKFYQLALPIINSSFDKYPSQKLKALSTFRKFSKRGKQDLSRYTPKEIGAVFKKVYETSRKFVEQGYH